MFSSREHEEDKHAFCFKFIAEISENNCLMIQELH